MRCMAQHGMRCMAHSMTCMEHVCCIHQSWPKKLIIVYAIFFGKRNFRTFAAQPRQWNTYYKKNKTQTNMALREQLPCASLNSETTRVCSWMHACMEKGLYMKSTMPEKPTPQKKRQTKKKTWAGQLGGMAPEVLAPAAVAWVTFLEMPCRNERGPIGLQM